MSTRIRSFCKINLGLSIGPSRPDGFHELTTVYQSLAFSEMVTVAAIAAPRNSITITSNHPLIPVDARNTAWRMVERSLAELRMAAEVRIHIEKQLPLQSGLGAGSANAIAALVGLERELGCQIPAASRLRIAAGVGSDVPFFALGGTAIGIGRGEEVYAMPDLSSLPCVLALPEIGVSTSEAYRDLDRLREASPESGGSLTGSPSSATIDRLRRSIAVVFGVPFSSGVFPHGEGRAETSLLALVRTGIENDFETVVFPKYPFLGEIKRILVNGSTAEELPIYAALSGSGSALFGLYQSSRAAERTLERLQHHGVTGLLTRTLPREEYWQTMIV